MTEAARAIATAHRRTSRRRAARYLAAGVAAAAPRAGRRLGHHGRRRSDPRGADRRADGPRPLRDSAAALGDLAAAGHGDAESRLAGGGRDRSCRRGGERPARPAGGQAADRRRRRAAGPGQDRGRRPPGSSVSRRLCRGGRRRQGRQAAYREAERLLGRKGDYARQTARRGACGRSTEEFLKEVRDWNCAVAEIRAWQHDYPGRQDRRLPDAALGPLLGGPQAVSPGHRPV